MKKKPAPSPVQPAPGTASGPFRLAELCLYAAAAVFGFLYLRTDRIPIGLLLPVYTAVFAVIGVLRLLDARRTGQKQTFARLTAISWFFLAAVFLAGTVLYFLRT